jgi:SAM-dependent methyltransferase
MITGIKDDKDYLWLNLRDLPYFRALLRAVEARKYQDFALTEPILDLGCGDGHFASITFEHKIDVGLDPWIGPLRKASLRGIYKAVIRSPGNHIPFAEGSFSSAISNSVLEHIPAVDEVLAETARVLKPGSLFLFCVPNQRFLQTLSISNWLDDLGRHRLAGLYRAFFNRISRHHHCDSPEIWQKRLEGAGFRVENWHHYFSPAALKTLEWGHYLGLPAWVCHLLFQRWIIAPYRWNLGLTQRCLMRYYQESGEQPEGAYTFYVARRIKLDDEPAGI